MGVAEALGVLIGILVPPVVDKVQRAEWPAWVKLLVALGTSIVIGTATAAATGELASTGDWWGVVTAVFVASQVAYRTWWHRDRGGQKEAAGQ